MCNSSVWHRYGLALLELTYIQEDHDKMLRNGHIRDKSQVSEGSWEYSWQYEVHAVLGFANLGQWQPEVILQRGSFWAYELKYQIPGHWYSAQTILTRSAQLWNFPRNKYNWSESLNFQEIQGDWKHWENAICILKVIWIWWKSINHSWSLCSRALTKITTENWWWKRQKQNKTTYKNELKRISLHTQDTYRDLNRVRHNPTKTGMSKRDFTWIWFLIPMKFPWK